MVAEGWLQSNGVRINSVSSPTIKVATKFVSASHNPPEPARSKVSIFKYGPASALSVLNCPRQLNCIIADATTEPDGAKVSKLGISTAPG